jgi:aquaporin Z
MRALVAELFGTFCLVFAGTGAVVVNEVQGGAVTHVGVALTFGLVVLALIYALGEVSGAHLNPAVTLGFWAAGRFPARRVAPYVLSQCLGALLASLLLLLLFLGETTTLGATRPVGPPARSFVLEAALTLFLMFVILSVSTGAKEKGVMAGVAVGAVIALEALFAGPVCGASMNPARSLAPAVASLDLRHLWLYLIAPPLGAGLAVLLCRCIHDDPCCGACAEERHPMTEPTAATPKRVLFVCVENSNRSQMAEAFARMHSGDGVEALSAGSRPSGRINPRAVAFMKEVGYDLTTHRSKALADLPDGEFDAVVGMGCGDEGCPLVKARRHEEWGVPDPKEMPDEQYREVRDLIERKVKELLASL